MKYIYFVLIATIALAAGCELMNPNNWTGGSSGGDKEAYLVFPETRTVPPGHAGTGNKIYLIGTVRSSAYDEDQFQPNIPFQFAGDARFHPKSPSANWTPGWLEFAPLESHYDYEAVAPRAPYLEGYHAPGGKFYPSYDYVETLY